MTRVTQIEVVPIRRPITRPFPFSSGSAGAAGESATFLVVRLTDSSGEVGWGEGRPMPQWSYETAEAAVTTIRRYLAPAVLGLEITDRWGLHKRMHGVIGRGPSTGFPIAKAAVDMALHDLCARAAGQSLRGYLGGTSAERTVELSYTLTARAEDELRLQIAEAQELGYRHFNFKAAVEPK